MRQLKRIIVGYDLRTGGENAIQSAVALAGRYGAALKLVHAIEPYHSYQRLSHPFTPPYPLEELAQKAGEQLEARVQKPDLALLHVEYEVRAGKAFVELIIARRAWQADLIVVGGSAQEGEGSLGRTGERVVRKALVPVLIAKKPFTAAAKRFLVPTDFSPSAKKAAEEALVLAESFGGRILFVHALEPLYSYPLVYEGMVGAPPPLPPLTPADIEDEWQEFLASLPSLGKVPWEKLTVEGRAATMLVRQAEESQADLIVIGTHGRSGLAHLLLGSVAEEVINSASCPVLTIRPDAFQFELP
jgi:nucleotide-binding universal stress UspA family protein